MKQPECLHIPTLHEGKSAQISWGVVGTDANYLLERVFNDSFETALLGYTWDNYDSTYGSWNKHEQELFNWNQIESLTGKGRTWENLDYEHLYWSQIEDSFYTWKQFELQDISFEIFRGLGSKKAGVNPGIIWLDLDDLIRNWNGLELSGYSWEEFELLSLPGISWDDIEARWQTFDEWEKNAFTFQEWENQWDEGEHQEMTDSISIGATTAAYRMKAYNADGDTSEYLTTDILPVIPLFYRNDTAHYPVQAGKRYWVLLRAADVYGLDQIRMNLCYDPQLLTLTNFAAHTSGYVYKPGKYPEAHLDIYYNSPGKVRFQSTQPMQQDECFSGSITLVEFTAKENGTAKVSLN